jgi:hypothetical protein
MGRDRPYDPGNFCHARCSGSANIDAVLRPWPQRSIQAESQVGDLIEQDRKSIHRSGEVLQKKFEDVASNGSF